MAGRAARERYGARATAFELGVDPSEYHARPEVPRRRDTAVFYARDFTPDGVELGLLALELLHRQRPDLRIVLYGTHNLVRAPFASEQLGVETSERLSRLYAEATVGLSLSLTNYSIPNEMLACGLPVVELAARLRRSTARTARFSRSARDDPGDIAEKLAALLDDAARGGCRARGWTSCAPAPGRTPPTPSSTRCGRSWPPVDAPRSPAWSRTTPSGPSLPGPLASLRPLLMARRIIPLLAAGVAAALCAAPAATASPDAVIRDCADDGTLNGHYSNSISARPATVSRPTSTSTATAAR